jgi:DnaJ family protein B protein 13
VEHPTALFGSKFGGLHGMNKAANAEGPKQGPPVIHELDVTLDELYSGVVKKNKITRKILDENGMTTSEDDTILTVNVGKGWKDGTQIVFPREGDQGLNIIPADIIFVVKQVKHTTFERDGDDLVDHRLL